MLHQNIFLWCDQSRNAFGSWTMEGQRRAKLLITCLSGISDQPMVNNSKLRIPCKLRTPQYPEKRNGPELLILIFFEGIRNNKAFYVIENHVRFSCLFVWTKMQKKKRWRCVPPCCLGLCVSDVFTQRSHDRNHLYEPFFQIHELYEELLLHENLACATSIHINPVSNG